MACCFNEAALFRDVGCTNIVSALQTFVELASWLVNTGVEIGIISNRHYDRSRCKGKIEPLTIVLTFTSYLGNGFCQIEIVKICLTKINIFEFLQD
jgi:hypothetical protein